MTDRAQYPRLPNACRVGDRTGPRAQLIDASVAISAIDASFADIAKTALERPPAGAPFIDVEWVEAVSPHDSEQAFEHANRPQHDTDTAQALEASHAMIRTLETVMRRPVSHTLLSRKI